MPRRLRRWLTPRSPASRISRATRLRPTPDPEPEAQLGVHARRSVGAAGIAVDTR